MVGHTGTQCLYNRYRREWGRKGVYKSKWVKAAVGGSHGKGQARHCGVMGRQEGKVGRR